MYPFLKISCSRCGKERNYKPVRERVFAGSHQATDPYCGLPLWLQADFNNYVLWAYNSEHLQYLKAYIGARLREKNGQSFRTLAQKLPAFLREAKHRDALLKLITKLEKK